MNKVTIFLQIIWLICAIGMLIVAIRHMIYDRPLEAMSAFLEVALSGMMIWSDEIVRCFRKAKKNNKNKKSSH